MIQGVAEQMGKDYPEIFKNVQAHIADSYVPEADHVLYFIGMQFSLPKAHNVSQPRQDLFLITLPSSH
jgi:hypothetical protein